MYTGCLLPQIPGAPVQALHQWQVFTALTEEATELSALEMAQKRIGPAPVGSDIRWRPCSDMPDERWSKTLVALGFPGYPEREGMERWSGF